MALDVLRYRNFKGYSTDTEPTALSMDYLTSGSQNIDLTRALGGLAKRQGFSSVLSSSLGSSDINSTYTYRRSSGEVFLIGYNTGCFRLSGAESSIVKTSDADFNAGTADNYIDISDDSMKLYRVASILDQFAQDFGTTGDIEMTSTNSAGQTFVPQLPYIHKIKVRCGLTGTNGTIITCKIYDGTAKTNLLGTATAAWDNNDWITFTFSSGVAVTPSSTYYFELTTAATSVHDIKFYYNEDTYTGGQAYNNEVAQTDDLYFEVYGGYIASPLCAPSIDQYCSYYASNIFVDSSTNIGQTFIPQKEYIVAIALKTTNGRFDTGDNFCIRIYDNPDRDTLLGTSEVYTSPDDDLNGVLTVRFLTPVHVTPGQSYYFQIEAGVTDIQLGGNASSDGSYSNGSMYLDGVAQTGDFYFTMYGMDAYYCGTAQEWLSPIYDTGQTNVTASLSWNITTPTGASVIFKVRGSANGVNLGDWQTVSSSGDGVPLMRYLQVDIIASTEDTTVTPTISDFTITYTTAYDTAASIKTGLSGNRIRFCEYEDNCYFAEGGRPQRYNGTSVTAVGVDPPGSAPTLADSGTTGLPDGTYKACVTFVDSLDAESNGGTESGSVTVSLKKINWSSIPTGPSGTAKRRLYRTKAGGAVYYYVGELANNTTTTYLDNTDDDDLVTPLLTDNNIPPDATIVAVYRDYMLYVSADYPSRVYFSKAGNPSAVPTTHYKAFAGPILAVKVYQNAVIVGGEGFLSAVIGEVWDDDLETNTAKIVDISLSAGPLSHESVAECFTVDGDILIYPTRLGVGMLTPGMQEDSLRGGQISSPVQSMFDGAVNKDNMSAIFYDQKYIIAFNYYGTDTPVQTNNVILVYDLRTGQWSPPWTIPASCFNIINGTLYFGSPSSGQIYCFDGTSSDDGSDIEAIAVLCPEFTEKGITKRKRYKRLFVAVSEDSVPDSISVTAQVDIKSVTLTPTFISGMLISNKMNVALSKGRRLDVTVQDTSTNDWVINELALEYRGR